MDSALLHGPTALALDAALDDFDDLDADADEEVVGGTDLDEDLGDDLVLLDDEELDEDALDEDDLLELEGDDIGGEVVDDDLDPDLNDL